MKDRILGQVAVITPNVDEAAALTGLAVGTMDQMQLAAQRLPEMGVRNVIVTGGHLDPPHDLVSREGRRSAVLEGVKISSDSTHGTGCAFSSALACSLAKGNDLLTAARAAKHYVESSMRKALSIGKGTGPVV
jgi:hydroxymethylpyrimidine/phosphomethylpyrimidine kinase